MAGKKTCLENGLEKSTPIVKTSDYGRDPKLLGGLSRVRADSIQITSIADIADLFVVAVGVGDLTRSGQGPANIGLWLT